jgi:hypothetical protein
MQGVTQCPPFPILEISDDYVDLLPELPLDVFKNRLNSAVRRKGKEKATGASGGPDLFKMNVKAVHTGAKNFFGRNKRVHNVLSTQDWGVRPFLTRVRVRRLTRDDHRSRWKS